MKLGAEASNITFASNGLQAWEIWVEHPELFDVCLLDCQMPRIEGLEVAFMIRKHLDETGGPHVPIIMHSATTINPKAVASAGADLFVEKPFTVAKWRNALERLRVL